MEHSKLPWRIDKENWCIASADDTAILKYRHSIGPIQLANAELIILAVNAHKGLTKQRDDLLAACENILPQIHRAYDDYQEARYIDTEALEAAIDKAK